MRPSYLYNGNSYTGKRTTWYWDGSLTAIPFTQCHYMVSRDSFTKNVNSLWKFVVFNVTNCYKSDYSFLWQNFNSQHPFWGVHGGQRQQSSRECYYYNRFFFSNPVVSSTIATDVVQNTLRPVAVKLEEIVTPVNAQHLNNWLAGYDSETRGHLHTGFTKGFWIHCREAARVLQQKDRL